MSEEQYWDEDPELARAYRKAEELRRERRNQEMWLQGMYVYDAIGRISPILHDYVKKGTKPEPYVEEAYPITKQSADLAEKKQKKAKAVKNKTYMETYMAAFNEKFKKEGGKDGCDG